MRERMSIVINKADDELLNWFYEKGSKEELPPTWEKFKEEFLFECTGKSFEQMKRYKEETLSDFIIGLRKTAENRKIDNDTILKKLRKERIPKELLQLLYSVNVSLEKVIDSILESEKARIEFRKETLRNGSQVERRFKKNFKSQNDNKCFKCGNHGHFARNCKIKA